MTVQQIVEEIEQENKGTRAKAATADKPQRRKRSRKKVSRSGEAEIELRSGSNAPQVIPGKILDLSVDGVGIETTTPLNVDTVVIIWSQFFESQSGKQQKKDARVMHCRLKGDDLYHIGFAFERSSERTEDQDGADLSSADRAIPDYYEVLQVSPNADQEMIQRVYRMLAQRYHPDNQDTGSDETFRLVLQAYRVLSDAEQRASYDAKHRAAHKLRWKIFDRSESPQSLEDEKRVRWGILSALYLARKRQPHRPGMSIREMEDLLGCPREHLEFSLWYLKGKSQILPTDNGRYVITPEGVDAAAEIEGATFNPVPLLEDGRDK